MVSDNNKDSIVSVLENIAHAGQLREALNIALSSIRAGIYEEDLLYIAADIANKLGDLDKAGQLVRKLLEINPNSLSGWSLFGTIQSRMIDISRANEDFNKAKVISVVNKRTRKIPLGITEDESVSNIKKTSPDVSFDTVTFAEICTKQGYYHKALKIYHDLLLKDPESEDLKERIKDLEKRLGNNDR
jgi:tetratricopeptide (TPR) repeat protein